jgi:hypothetical protein
MQSISEKRRLQIQKAAEEGRVELAPAEKITRYAALLHDFMEHVVGVTSYLLTDYSCIQHFGGDDAKKDIQRYQRKIYERYGVRMRLGTKHSSGLCDILERLAMKIAALEE